jgi:hypothetical protein
VKPIYAVLSAIALAVAVNVYIFATRVELSAVASQTIFANTITVLSLVPIYLILLLKQKQLPIDMPSRVKVSLKAVAIFALCMAITTAILFNTSGEYLIHDRLVVIQQLLKDSGLTAEEQANRLLSAQRIYSPATQVLIGTIATLFTGFISSIVASVAVRSK